MTEPDAVKLLELTARTERAVLSALTYDAKFRAAWTPDPELFSSPATKALAVAIARCQRAGWDGDDQQVALELRRDDALKHFHGGAEGVTDLLVGTPAVVDPWSVLEHLRELRALRSLRHSLQDALRATETTCDLSAVRALVSEAQSASYAGAGHQATGLRTALAQAFHSACDPAQKVRGLYTGVRGIDSATGGIRRGEVWVVVALSNWGKSAFLLNLADRATAAGIRPLIVHGEDAQALYARRWLARRTGVHAYKFRDNELTPEEMQRVSEVVEHMPDWPCFLDGIGRSCESLAADIRSLVASDGIGLVLVDYIQVFRVATKLEPSQRIRIAHIARTFTDAIKTAGAAGVQFSQATEEKDGSIHARDADEIRQWCEVMLLGSTQKEKNLNPAGQTTGELERKFLYADKVKDGHKGFTVELDWEPQFAAFQRDDRIYRPAEDWHDND